MMFLFTFRKASSNGQHRNLLSTPTPYRISKPPIGEWMYDKHERPLTAHSFCILKFGISLKV